MSELSEPEITTKTLEHYGLVAAVCQKLRIAVGKALDATSITVCGDYADSDSGIAKIHVSDFSILYIGQYQINGEYEMVVSSS